MTYPAYPEYEDSGVDWIGRKPKHWSVMKLHHIVRMKSGSSITSIEMDDDGEYPVFGGNAVRGRYSNYTHDGNYVLVGRQGAECGNINYAYGKFWASEHAVVLTPDREFELHWLGETLRAMNLNQYSQSAAQPGLSVEVIGRLKLPFPPIPEQKRIASFLNYKTAQIDALIAKKKELIEKLKEQRIAVITQAITKGLDPNAPMRDSGVEWLGQVPKDWAVKRTKFVLEKIGSGKTPSGGATVYVDSGVMLLRSQNIYDEGLRLDDVVYMTEEADELQAASRVQPSDVLLNITGASIGRASVVPKQIPPTNVNQHVCILRPVMSEVVPEYMHLLLCSKISKEQIFSTENGTSREGLNFPQVGNLVFPFPDMPTQINILHYCETISAKLHALISRTQKVIERLTEYRTALITAATTGKIDVRGISLDGAK